MDNNYMNQDQIKTFITNARAKNVPDEETLGYLRQKGVTIPGETPSNKPGGIDSGVEDKGNFSSNLANSAGEFVKGIGETILHPIDTGKNLLKIGGGAVDLALGDGQGDNADAARAVGNYFKGRYGGWENIKNTMYTDPIGLLADASTLAGGAGLALKGTSMASKVAGASKIAQTAEELANTAGKVSRYTDPLTGVKKVSDVTGLSTKVDSAATTVKQGFSDLTEKVRRPIDTIRNIAADSPADNFPSAAKRQIEIKDPTTSELRLETPEESNARVESIYNKAANDTTKYKVDTTANAHPLDNLAETYLGKPLNSIVDQASTIGAEIGDITKRNYTRIAIKPAIQAAEQAIRDAGLMITRDGKLKTNPRTGLTVGDQEVAMLTTAYNKLRELGDNPTIEKLQNAKRSIARTLDLTKQTSNVKGTTFADKLAGDIYGGIKTSLEGNTNPKVKRLLELNDKYSELQSILSKGRKILGDETLTSELHNGEAVYKRATSVAKALAKSVHSGDARSFVKELERVTGTPILDNLTIGMQAIQDVGDYKVASLLEKIAQGTMDTFSGIPSASGMIDRAGGAALNKLKEKTIGTREQRTRRYIKNLNETPTEKAKVGGADTYRYMTKRRSPLSAIPGAFIKPTEGAVINNTQEKK
jgi:hypothetical protein